MGEMSVGLVHPFEPVWDKGSRILVLGSFPSVASRENGFYYGHTRNRFWAVLAALCGCNVPQTIPDKTALLKRGGIALWDVLSGCDIEGSSDASIRNAMPNDIAALCRKAPIERIFLNGRKAGDIFARTVGKSIDLPAEVLPSTSPANAAKSLESLIEAWGAAIGMRPSAAKEGFRNAEP